MSSNILIEAENMNLTNYRVESGINFASGNGFISLLDTDTTQGAATTQFTGTTGVYNVVVGYFDEDDGESSLSLSVGENSYNWTLDQNLGDSSVSSNNLVQRTIATGLHINSGETITLTGIANHYEFARVDYIKFVEAVDFTIEGTEAAENLTGNELDNTINGFGGDDVLNGDAGDDTLISGSGNKILNGGAGIDTVNYAQATSSIVADLGTGLVTGKSTNSGDPIRIMPLGDSNTRGFGSDSSGYRDDLAGLLTDEGLNIDFVGSESTGSNQFDDNHEGHGGWTINEIADSVNVWLNTYNPHIVLLMLGTNDTDSSNANQMANRLSQLIDQITDVSPNAHLLVGSIIPNTSSQGRKQTTKAFNSKIPGIVNNKTAQGKKVTFVDVGSALNDNDILSDGLHATPQAYRKIAKVWEKAILKTSISQNALNATSEQDTLYEIENITGSSFNDVLIGDAGANVLDGGEGEDLLTGNAGEDVFVLTTGNGTGTITDFVVGEDLLGLSGGLTFEQVTITQGTGNNVNDTFIFEDGKQLAIVNGVEKNLITAEVFTVV
ncbi:MAG: hypothetical protein F6J89_18000 [Symploca sp. SIO1C4]|uniref:SGNH hydrolase-type esterase domain-containing protein n=1 Tax=Symploca sp. SIO1C4 TaxID=2607765 RepID=A0A6B3NFU5_9CYAN|nr:hypothetical protein [Symploca sp. SIO1C4]